MNIHEAKAAIDEAWKTEPLDERAIAVASAKLLELFNYDVDRMELFLNTGKGRWK